MMMIVMMKIMIMVMVIMGLEIITEWTPINAEETSFRRQLYLRILHSKLFRLTEEQTDTSLLVYHSPSLVLLLYSTNYHPLMRDTPYRSTCHAVG